jgi:hypothetical protein
MTMFDSRCLVISAFAILVQGCGDRGPTPAGTENANGRSETESIRATEAIGVEGEAIGRKVDAILDANDQRKDELDKAIDSQ